MMQEVIVRFVEGNLTDEHEDRLSDVSMYGFLDTTTLSDDRPSVVIPLFADREDLAELITELQNPSV